MRLTPFKKSLLAVSFFFVLSGASPGAAFFPSGKAAPAQDYKKLAAEAESRIPLAEERILAGIAGVEGLIRSKKVRKSDMTGAWTELRDQTFSAPVIAELEDILRQLRTALAKAAEGKADVAAYEGLMQEGSDLTGFAREIITVEEVLDRVIKINIQIESLKLDIDNAPLRMKVYTEEMKRINDALEEIMRNAARGQKNPPQGEAALGAFKNSLENSIKEVTVMKHKIQSASSSLVSTTKYLGDRRQLRGSFSDGRRMQVLSEYWADSGKLYPALRKEITDAVVRWTPLYKEKWQNYLDVRKAFLEIFVPLLEGNLFQGITLFEGKKYDALDSIIINIEILLRAELARVAGQEKDLEGRKQALQQDESLTRKEVAEFMQLVAQYGPEKCYSLRTARYRAGGGSARAAELKRILESSLSGSDSYKKAQEELTRLEKWQHPEQIAAAAAWKTFFDQLKDAQKRMDTLVADHTSRKKALGLDPVLKKSALATDKSAYTYEFKDPIVVTGSPPGK